MIRSIKVILIFFCIIAGGCDTGVSSPFKQGDKPNVLFIAIDDMNDWAGHLGGHPQAKTPNIDALAKEGLYFSKAYAAAPACSPSRWAVLTGIQPSSSGVYTNSHENYNDHDVYEDVTTLPRYFKGSGYYVLGSGKIFHGQKIKEKTWNKHWPWFNQRFNDPQPERLNLNGLDKGVADWGPIQIEDQEMSDTKTVNWISDKLQDKYSNPFFMAVGLYRPHLPWYVPQKYFDGVPPLSDITLPETKINDMQDIPPAGHKMKSRPMHQKIVANGQWRNGVRSYLASLSYADHNVGRILDALKKSEYAENTIVVLWSDHGFSLGEKEHWRKFALWDNQLRVPLIFKVPAGLVAELPEGTTVSDVSHRPVSLMDIFPTLIELCGLKPIDELQAVSLMPLLKNEKSEWNRMVLSTYEKGNHTVRSERWRYIRYADGSEELYDHEKDQNEFDNVASKKVNRSVIEQHKKWLPEINAEAIVW